MQQNKSSQISEFQRPLFIQHTILTLIVVRPSTLYYSWRLYKLLETNVNTSVHFQEKNKGTEGSRSLAIFSPINIDHSSRVQEKSVLTMPLIQNAEKINNSGFLCSKGTLGPIHINTLGEYPYM